MEQFLKEASSALSADDLWDAFARYFDRLGFDRFSYVHFPRLGAEDGLGWARLRGFPDTWIAQYIEGALFRDDPIRAHAQIHSEPFKWSEIPDQRPLTDREVAFLKRLSVYYSGDGVAIPVFGPGGRNGYTVICLPEGMTDFPPELMLEFQLVSQYAHQRYCAIVAEPEPEPVSVALSPREREVLRWVARGKSNSVIAEIIGVSTNTVDTHLRRIYQKLNVGDRVSAVLAGLGQGFIMID